KAPIREFRGPASIAYLVQQNLARARIQAPTNGAHQFRHALATEMLHHGASLAEIGDVLRHRSPETTKIYTSIDLDSLRTLALPWPGCAMNTLRQAVEEYLILRRSLGFKLYKAGKLLPAFVKFMEERRASYITSKLALAWAQQPSAVQPVVWAQRLSVVRTFARHRSATDPRTQVPP